ncbi:MAG: hypothetical protein WC100_05110 [Sterolibacterium sp.]
MKILEYIGLDTSSVKMSYRRVTDAIARDDFHAAQVKKLANLSHGKFYRAKLDDADRLLFSLVKHGDQVCALMPYSTDQTRPLWKALHNGSERQVFARIDLK